MKRYILDKVGVTTDYYIRDTCKDNEIISMVTGVDFAEPIVDLLNYYVDLLDNSGLVYEENDVDAFLDYMNRPSTDEELESLQRAEKVYHNLKSPKNIGSMSLRKLKSMLSSVFDQSDEELQEGALVIKSNSDYYYDWKAIQYDGTDVILTFNSTPSHYVDNKGVVKDYSVYLSDMYMDYDYEQIMIMLAYKIICEDDDLQFVELFNVDGRLLGRFSVHDYLMCSDSSVIIQKDYDVTQYHSFGCGYSVDFKDIYALKFI